MARDVDEIRAAAGSTLMARIAVLAAAEPSRLCACLAGSDKSQRYLRTSSGSLLRSLACCARSLRRQRRSSSAVPRPNSWGARHAKQENVASMTPTIVVARPNEYRMRCVRGAIAS